MAGLVIGEENIFRILDRLGDPRLAKRLTNNALRGAARENLVPVVRDSIPSDGPFPNLDHLKRKVTVRTLKKSTGVYVGIRGRDIPLGKKWYTIAGYTGLVIRGSYKGNRSTGKGQNRGKVEGLGYSPFERAYKSKGRVTLQSAGRHLEKALDREVKRLNRKYAG